MFLERYIAVRNQNLGAEQCRADCGKPDSARNGFAVLVAYNCTAEAKLEVLGKRAEHDTDDEGKGNGYLHWCHGFKTKLFKHINSTFLVCV